jgi:hypothetical protein
MPLPLLPLPLIPSTQTLQSEQWMPLLLLLWLLKTTTPLHRYRRL